MFKINNLKIKINSSKIKNLNNNNNKKLNKKNKKKSNQKQLKKRKRLKLKRKYYKMKINQLIISLIYLILKL